ncbi:MAG: phosphodiester glycosidase family protein [Pseudomonadota bacterium]
MITAILFPLSCALFGLCGGEVCYDLTHNRNDYIVCSFRADRISVSTRLNDDSGAAFGRIGRLQQHLQQNNSPTLMIMNGGMYHSDLSPVGLYVEGSQQQKTISTKPGWGNFHLLPNGVFFVENGKSSVLETKTYLSRKRAPDFATQSGPMLVIDGRLHHRFLKDSDSLKIRNGVGVSADQKTLHFAISKGNVRFWDFGVLFRDQLKTPNALFLDGTVSGIWSKNHTRTSWRSLGPMIVVVRQQPLWQRAIYAALRHFSVP